MAGSLAAFTGAALVGAHDAHYEVISAGTPSNLAMAITVAANTKGAYIHRIAGVAAGGNAGVLITQNASLAAAGNIMLYTDPMVFAVTAGRAAFIERPIFVPAGWGVGIVTEGGTCSVWMATETLT